MQHPIQSLTQPRRPQHLGLRRPAFTLLELMLVLSLIVIIGSIATPMMTEAYERQKLIGAANHLRMKWDRARLEAMRTGQAQVFDCTLGANDFRVKPLVLQTDFTNVGADATVMVGASLVETTTQSGYYTSAETSDQDSEKLDENISFLSCYVASDMRSLNLAQESTSSGLGDVSVQTVAQQVIFYADGSTSTAEVQIQNKRGDVRAVQMRGLTGFSRVMSISNTPTQADK